MRILQYPEITSWAGTEGIILEDASNDSKHAKVGTLVYKRAAGDYYANGALTVNGAISQPWAASHNHFIGTQFLSSYENGLRFLEATRETRIVAKAADETGIISFYTGSTPTKRGEFSNSGLSVAGAMAANGSVVSNGASAGFSMAERGGADATTLYMESDAFRAYIDGADRLTLSKTGNLAATGDVQTGTNFRLAGGVPLATLSGNYVVLFDPAGVGGMLFGNATDPTNYYANTTHAIYNRDRSTRYGIWGSNGLSVGPQGPGSDADVSRLLVQNDNSSEYATGTFTCQRADGGRMFTIFNGGIGGISSAGTVAMVAKNTATGRSMNLAGTLNASGADYAEYMEKAEGCAAIAKGQIVGVDAEGKLTDRFADARSFVVKSTDPALVGGDGWGHGIERPELPAIVLPEYDGPQEPEPVAPPPPAPEPLPMPEEPGEPPIAPEEPVRGDGEGDVAWAKRVNAYVVAHAAYLIAAGAHEAAVAAYPGKVDEIVAANAAAQQAWEAAVAEHAEATAAYLAAIAEFEAAHEAHGEAIEAAQAAFIADVAAWEAAQAEFEATLEAARQKVDRIAFSGQVPCNVSGDFAVGDYVIPAQDGEGIKAVAVPAAEITFEQYQCRVGKIWAIREGRAWIDVQHG